MLQVGSGQQIKDEIFKLAEKKNNKLSDLSDNKMCLSILITIINKKSIDFLLLLNVFPNLHPNCSFHTPNLLISFVIGFDRLCLD